MPRKVLTIPRTFRGRMNAFTFSIKRGFGAFDPIYTHFDYLEEVGLIKTARPVEVPPPIPIIPDAPALGEDPAQPPS